MYYEAQQSYLKREEKEFDEFMAKLIDKCREVNDDFEKLSPANKQRVLQSVLNGVSLEAIRQFMNVMMKYRQ